MRRATAIVLTVIFILCFACTVFAANSATRTSFSANVSSNGNCQVTLDVQLHLDTADKSLTLPLPANARSITLNGKSAHASRRGDVLMVKLSSLTGNAIGDFSARLQYTLPNTVGYDEQGKLQLNLPLLSGFSYAIDTLEFSVTLPGVIQSTPVFTSGYYQQSIESHLAYTVTGERLTGTVLSQLKDLETLSMTLEVSDEMFPQDPTEQWTMGVEEIAMIVLASAALLYWIFFLRCAPFRRIRCTSPTEGLTAGTLSCALTGQGADLTMMVLSWAQLGYILIHLQDSGRVTLHKRMEMGNERSAYEVRIFRSLFGKRSMIDGTGYHYAKLYRKTASSPGDIKALFRLTSGNPKFLRVLCALAGVFGGISLGNALAGDALLGFVLVGILAVFGGVSSWILQTWGHGLHLRHRHMLIVGLVLAALWMLLGIMAGEAGVSACAVALQLLCGLAWFYGGRRTALGRQTAAEILGLRRCLRTLSPGEIQRICRIDPDYFFNMAPYAVALGVDRSFAERFGKQRLNSCPYLTTGMDAHMTALEWSETMRRAVSSLDDRQLRLPLERLLGKQ